MTATVIVQVWFKPEARQSERFQFEFVEVDGGAFEQFEEAVAADELISAWILHSHGGSAPGERVIHRRTRMTFRGSAVARAQEPTWRFVEAEA